MKKLLYLFLTVALIGCTGSDDVDYEYFSEELENNVYTYSGVSRHSNGSGPDLEYNYDVYYSFDFNQYAYYENVVTDWPERSECYATYYQEGGVITSNEKDAVTYLLGSMTYRYTRQGTGVKMTVQRSSGSVAVTNLTKSSSDDLANAIEGKRSSNTCD